MVKGYKNFNNGLKCKNFQFEVGKTYKHDGPISLCSSGFHFHKNAFDLFSYYPFDFNNTETCLIEASGEILDESNKSVCSEIKIIKKLNIEELKDLGNMANNTGWANSGNRNSGDWNSGYCNSGNWNSGDWNSGNRNSGNCNSGDWNSGNRNSGDWNSGYCNSGDWNSGYCNSGNRNSGNRNSGNWNSGDWNVGDFNTITQKDILVFNKPIKRSTWNATIKPKFIYNVYTTMWIDESEMSDKEKTDHPEFFCQKGYLKTISYKDAWSKAWANREEDDKKLLEALPNFDWNIFTKITGIKKPE